MIAATLCLKSTCCRCLNACFCFVLPPPPSLHISARLLCLLQNKHGGLTDYLDPENIPDFLGGPCKVHAAAAVAVVIVVVFFVFAVLQLVACVLHAMPWVVFTRAYLIINDPFSHSLMICALQPCPTM